MEENILSPDEEQAIKEQFDEFDSDKSGKLDQSELKQILEQLGYDRYSPIFLENFFNFLNIGSESELNYNIYKNFCIKFDEIDQKIESQIHQNSQQISINIDDSQIEKLLPFINISSNGEPVIPSPQEIAKILEIDTTSESNVPNTLNPPESTTQFNSNDSSLSNDEKFLLEKEEKDYIKQTFQLFLSQFDQDNDQTISISELKIGLRTMGFDPSNDELEEIIKQHDADNTGTIDEEEFIDFYLALFKKTEKSIPLDKLTALFNKYDDDNSGEMSKDEFTSLILSLCPSYSLSSLSTLYDKMDEDHSGDVEFEEFFAFLQDSDDIGAVRLRRSIIRCLMPLPSQNLSLFCQLPSTCRECVLSTRCNSLSSFFFPKLAPNGLEFQHFNLEKNSNTIDETKAWSISISLLSSQGIPSPPDNMRTMIRNHLVHLRCYDNQTPITNTYTYEAGWKSSEEDIWILDQYQKSKHFADEWLNYNLNNQFIIRTDCKQITIIIEFAIVLEVSPQKYKQISVGHIKLECQHNMVNKEEIRKCPLIGGSLKSSSNINSNEVLKRRTGLKKLSKLFSDSISQISLSLNPISSLSSTQLKYISTFPPNIIVSTRWINSLYMIRDIYADIVLRKKHPLFIGCTLNPSLKICSNIIDQPDLLSGLSLLWDNEISHLHKEEKKDINNIPNPVKKQKFLQLLNSFISLFSLPSFPTLSPGINEKERRDIAFFMFSMIPNLNLTGHNIETANLSPLAIEKQIERLSLVKTKTSNNSFFPFHTDELRWRLNDVGKKITVELKNDLSFQGTLLSIDQYLNIKLTDITIKQSTQFPQLLAISSCFIRGSVVRYIHLIKDDVDIALLQDACRRAVKGQKP